MLFSIYAYAYYPISFSMSIHRESKRYLLEAYSVGQVIPTILP